MKSQQESNMRLLKKIILSESKKIYDNGYNIGVINIFSPNSLFTSPRIEISIVQNTMQYGVYGVSIRIQDYFIEENNESAQIDIYLDILQIEDNVLLSEGVIRVNGISHFRGSNRDDFINRLPSIFTNEWNNQ